MASPVVEAVAESASPTTAATSHTVTLPTGITSGDLLIVISDKGSTSATVNALTGWTELLDEASANGLYIAYREADGTEGASITLVTSASTRLVSIAYRISGAIDPATQAPQIGTTASGTSATPDPPASANPPSSKDYLFIAFAGMAGEEADDDTWGNTPPTNYTPSPPRQKTCGTVGSNLGGLILSAERALTTGSAENPGTFGVDTSAAWRAQTITVHPAPPPTTTGTARISLAAGQTPGSRTAHSIKVRARVQSGAGKIRAALYEGSTNITDTAPGYEESASLTTTLAEYTLAIDDADAAAIGSYADLELRLWGYSVGGGSVVYEIDQAWLETPLGSVSKTLAVSYNVVGSVSKTLAVSYNLPAQGQIPGTYPESSNSLGPFIDGNGNLYTVNEYQNAVPRPAMHKSTDGGYTWTEVDAAGAPQWSNWGDLESCWIQQVGTRLHIAGMRDGSNGNLIQHFIFATSDDGTDPDGWQSPAVIDQNVPNAPVDQAMSLIARGNDLYAFWNFYDGTVQQIAYNKKTGAGAWGARQIITTASVNLRQPVVTQGTLAAGDPIYIGVHDDTNNRLLLYKLDSSDVLTGPSVLATNSTTSSSGYHPMVTPARRYDAGGVDRCIFAWYDTAGLIRCVNVDDGVVQTEAVATDVAVWLNPTYTTSAGPTAGMALDVATEKLYIVYADNSTHDVWVATRDAAGAWGTDAELINNTTCQFVQCNVFTHAERNGSAKVLGYFWDYDPTATDETDEMPTYNQLVLSSATPVSKTLAVSFNKQQSIAKTLAASYNKRVSVAKTIGVTYNKQIAVTKTLAVTYNKIGRITKTLAISYTVAGRITKTLAVSYNKQISVAKTLAVSYNKQAAVAKTLAVSYSILAAAKATGVARISLASAGTPQTRTAHSIKIRARVTGGTGTIRASLWQGAAQIGSEHESSALTGSLADYTLAISDSDAASISDYSDLEIRLRGYSANGDAATFEVDQLWLEIPIGLASVSKTLAVSYNKQVSVSKTLAVSYNISSSTAVLKQLAVSYTLAGRISKTLTVSYLVRIKKAAAGFVWLFGQGAASTLSVSKTLAVSYNVEGSVSKTLSVSYNKRATISKTAPVAYNKRVTVSKTLTVSYNKQATISKTVAVGYTVVGRISKTQAVSYTVRAPVVKTIPAAYAVVGRITKTLAVSYNKRVTVAKTAPVTYTVIGRITKTLPVALNVRVVQAKTLPVSYNIVSQGAVSKTLAVTFNKRVQIAQTLAVSYNKHTTATKTLAVTYNKRAIVAKTATTTYNVVGRISKTLAVSYTVRIPVAKTVPIVYNVTGRATKTLAVAYNKRATVSKTAAVSYSVVGRITKTLAVTYNKRAIVAKTLAISYNIVNLGAVSKTLAVSYNKRVQLAKTLPVSYNKNSVISKTLAVSYNKQVAVSKTLAVSYNKRATVAKTVASAYTVIGRISKTLPVSYNKRVSVTKQVAVSFNIVQLGAVSKALAVSYNVRATVAKTAPVAYTLRVSASKQAAIAYTIRSLAVKTLPVAYTVRIPIAKTLATSYTVKAAITKTIPVTYNVRVILLKPFAINYNVISYSTVIKSISVTYNVKAQIPKTVVVTYNVRNRVANTLTTSYFLRRIVSKSVGPSYIIRTKIVKTLTTTYGVGPLRFDLEPTGFPFRRFTTHEPYIRFEPQDISKRWLVKW